MVQKRSPGKLQQIPPEKIDRNPDNPRLIFRQEEMDSLMVSIDTLGIQVPLTVYREGRGYRLIDGERRWRCARKLNLKAVPALVQEKPTELENLLLMYNIHALQAFARVPQKMGIATDSPSTQTLGYPFSPFLFVKSF